MDPCFRRDDGEGLEALSQSSHRREGRKRSSSRRPEADKKRTILAPSLSASGPTSPHARRHPGRRPGIHSAEVLGGSRGKPGWMGPRFREDDGERGGAERLDLDRPAPNGSHGALEPSKDPHPNPLPQAGEGVAATTARALPSMKRAGRNPRPLAGEGRVRALQAPSLTPARPRLRR